MAYFRYQKSASRFGDYYMIKGPDNRIGGGNSSRDDLIPLLVNRGMQARGIVHLSLLMCSFELQSRAQPSASILSGSSSREG